MHCVPIIRAISAGGVRFCLSLGHCIIGGQCTNGQADALIINGVDSILSSVRDKTKQCFGVVAVGERVKIYKHCKHVTSDLPPKHVTAAASSQSARHRRMHLGRITVPAPKRIDDFRSSLQLDLLPAISSNGVIDSLNSHPSFH